MNCGANCSCILPFHYPNIDAELGNLRAVALYFGEPVLCEWLSLGFQVSSVVEYAKCCFVRNASQADEEKSRPAANSQSPLDQLLDNQTLEQMSKKPDGECARSYVQFNTQEAIQLYTIYDGIA